MYRYHIYVRATCPSKEALFLRVYCRPNKRKRKRNPLPEYFPPRFLFTKQTASSTRVRTAMAPISPMNQPCVAMSSYKPEYSAHRSHTLRAGEPAALRPSRGSDTSFTNTQNSTRFVSPSRDPGGRGTWRTLPGENVDTGHALDWERAPLAGSECEDRRRGQADSGGEQAAAEAQAEATSVTAGCHGDSGVRVSLFVFLFSFCYSRVLISRS